MEFGFNYNLEISLKHFIQEIIIDTVKAITRLDAKLRSTDLYLHTQYSVIHCSPLIGY
jgi:hypothetical protein